MQTQKHKERRHSHENRSIDKNSIETFSWVFLSMSFLLLSLVSFLSHSRKNNNNCGVLMCGSPTQSGMCVMRWWKHFMCKWLTQLNQLLTCYYYFEWINGFINCKVNYKGFCECRFQITIYLKIQRFDPFAQVLFRDCIQKATTTVIFVVLWLSKLETMQNR